MARAIWKGRIQFETVDVPVKLYTAVGDIAVHSHLLHDQDYSRLQQRMVCPEDNVVVPPEETVKGYEIATGEYVVIESDELDFAEPQASRQIEVMEFVEAHEIDDRFLDRTYYLGPDGDEQGYVDLLQSLKETGAAGMCKWVMRRRAYVGVLAAAGDVLTLTMHRYAGEIVPEDAFELEDVDISEKEMQIAERLIHELAETFEPQKYKDEYQIKLQKLIEQKAQGRPTALPALEEAEATEDDRLLAALEKSLESLGGKEKK
ncbi:MAG TPA: Ku protein [Anaerohalosphaeraceae bacterium]|jgi:DNA end-binding protein Ku|nr:Ku protein [Anaerohalosphaeraceae bacterium]HRT49948.1 Ku protein [Anaerohalosphaeraceae bacterium]HRT85754.1 Ku protein [Anaerohalosphaeraceae bacterium]